jgi:dolichol-phosphate mannosyltransferase
MRSLTELGYGFIGWNSSNKRVFWRSDENNKAPAITMKRVMVLLPTLDEVEGVAEVVPSIPTSKLDTMGWKAEALVIDGGSDDGTIELAESLGCSTVRQHGKGKGAAMRHGFSLFLKGDYDVLVMLDADGTYHPEEIPHFLKALENCDVVVGDRLKGKMDPDAMTRTNYFGNHILTWCAVALYGVPMNDLCSGYWAFTRRSIGLLKLNSMRFEIEAEMYTSCALEELEMTHIPIRYSKRLGDAKLGSIKDGWNILRKLMVRRIFRAPPQSTLGQGNLNIE